MTTIDLGDLAEADVVFRNRDGEPADPTTVTFYVQAPTALAEVAYPHGGADDVVRVSVGAFRLTFMPTMRGRWRVRCQGTGAVQQAVTGWVQVG